MVSAVKKGDIKPFESYIGSLKYATLAKIAAESASPLEATFAEVGDFVKKNQVLARQDSAILSANIAAKSAELKKSEASRAQAAKDAERYKALLKQNSVSEQAYEQYRVKAEQESAQSEVLRANLAAMTLERDKRSIKAPFDGIVAERHASAGDFVGAGAAVISVAKMDSIEAIVYLPAAAIERLSVGSKAIVSVAGRDYDAKIAGFSPRGDEASRTFLTRVAINKPNSKLLEGMQATLKIEGKLSEDTLLVDRDAIIDRFGGQAVFYVEGGVAKLSGVEVVGYDGKLAAVRSAALKEGANVIVKGNERILPDQAVRVEK